MAEENETFAIEVDENRVTKSSKQSCFQRYKIIISAAIIGASLILGLAIGLNKETITIKNIFVTANPSEKQKLSTTTTTPISTTTEKLNGTWTSYRLPSYIRPTHYDLTITTDIENDTYFGTNSISITLFQSSSFVMFHYSDKITISETILRQQEKIISINHYIKYDTYDLYEIQTEHLLEEGNYTLFLKFNGSLVNGLNGYAKSEYKVPGSKDNVAITSTDMEPMDARRAFPCFDEPDMKATFSISLVHDDGRFALSNMDVKEVKDRGNGQKETIFNTTPVPMSTYLVCFAISNYSFVETISRRGIPIRIYAARHLIEKGRADYGIKVTKIILDYFEELFDMEYPLPKLDQIVIPDFSSGAMENWGLITYHETSLLWDPKTSTVANKQRVAAVISHELVHMWFGNTVTMDWWNNLWLNEGFASYFEYYGMNKAEPSWKMMDQFMLLDTSRAMFNDDTDGSHPIIPDEDDIKTSAIAKQHFSPITYSKGASIIRMMHNVLGDEVFFTALQRYLKHHRYKNTVETDLWSQLQQACEEGGLSYNISTLFNPWFRQMGFPILQVQNEENKLTVTQERMLDETDEETNKTSPYGYRWNIYVKYNLNDKEHGQMFDMNDQSISIDYKHGDRIKINPDIYGFYKVNYSRSIWQMISMQLQLNHEVYSEVDRASFLFDAFDMAFSGKLNYSIALEMTKYLQNERSYIVWKSIISHLSYIVREIKNSENYDDIKRYFLSKVNPVANELSWEATDSNHIKGLLQLSLFYPSLAFGNEKAKSFALEAFNNWIKNDSYHIIPEIRLAVYRNGMKEVGGRKEWDVMFQRYMEEDDANERSNLLLGLTSNEDLDLVAEFLELSKNKSIIKEQDFLRAVVYSSYSEVGKDVVWTWMRHNWDFIVERYEKGNRRLTQMIEYVTSGFKTEFELYEVKYFYDKISYTLEDKGKSREKAVSTIKKNMVWLEKNKFSVEAWIKQQR